MAAPAAGQVAGSEQLRAVAGCWASEVGAFTPPLPTDRQEWAGIPAVLQIDTVPGRGRDGAPLGRAIRTIVSGPHQHFLEGYLLPLGGEGLELHWTNFFSVGVAVRLRAARDRMTGVADAWTDMVTSNKAPVTLLRVACP